MSETEIKVPVFGDEREEADWWVANPEYLLEALKRAKAEGRLGQGTVARRMDEIRAAKAKSTTIPLEPANISLAKV